MKPRELEGKTVFITGASSGIGYMQAEAFLNQGANVFGIDLDETELQTLKQMYPYNFSYWIVDIRLQEEIAEAIRVALTEFTRIDILIHSAGHADDSQPTLESDEEQWDDVFETNLKSIYYTTNLILPHMLKWESGVIINTAATSEHAGAAFTASQHAIIGYTKQLSEDYADKGIKANIITPTEVTIKENQSESEKEDLKKSIEDAGQGERDLIEITLFLAGDTADNVNGRVIPVSIRKIV